MVNEHILEKQAEIDKLIDELIPEDIRQMIEELQELLQELNKDQLADMLKNMEMNSEKMEQMLDRNLDLLKQLQFEKSMNELLDRIEDLAEKLEQSAEETLNKTMDREELSEQLKEIQDAFEDETNTLEDLKEQNKNLTKPFSLEDTKGDEDTIKQLMNQGQEQLQKKHNKESSEKQNSAAGSMQQLRDKLGMMMLMSGKQQMAEDATAIRYLLENIVRSSLRQEDIMVQLYQMKRDDPAYLGVIQDQTTIAFSFKVIEDSLIAISKRQPIIKNFIFTEVSVVNQRVGEVQDFMKDR